MYEIGAKEIKAVKDVIERGSFFRYGGRETAAFEKEWADMMGTKFSCTVTSGTAALITGLKAMGIGPGDSVLVPGLTFVSSALAVTAAGAIPIYAEIDETLTMDPEDVERKIESHTACLLPVHMFGIPSNMRALKRIARKHDLRILEDCCQAVGGSYKGKRLGSIGDFGAYSFNQFKNISCGEGGTCVTSNKTFAERAFMAMDGSCSVWPETGKMHEAFFCGGNYRLNEINTAILRVQAGRLDGILTRLRSARRFLIDKLRLPDGYEIRDTHCEEGNCGATFLVRAKSVAAAIEFEKTIGEHIGCMRPINSGRHVYSHWDVIRDKVGGHHRDWDCFKHPKNKKIKTNYRKRMKQTDDNLARTCLMMVPYGEKRADLLTRVRKANDAIKGLA